MAKWTAADLPDLAGRTVIVTGASGGLGLVTARELARAGARVVLAVRDVGRGEQAAAGMSGDTEVRHLDLASLASVREFAARWTGDLDILINNAGIMQAARHQSEDGFELQLATNYLGPFALTNLLLPHVTDRVVTLTSQLHRRGRARLDDLNAERGRYSGLSAYSDSKLDDLLFTRELQRRLTAAGSTVRSVAAHPGVAPTNLAAHAGRMSDLFTRLTFLQNDVEHGALPTLYAATQDVPGGSCIGPDGLGGMKGYPKIAATSRAARDPEAAGRLWILSARLTGTGAVS